MAGVCFALILSATIAPTSQVDYSETWTTSANYPARLAPGPSDGVYITDPPGKQVVYYASGLPAPIAYPVAEGPVGIAVHTDGRVFLSRNDGKIGVYTADFNFQQFVDPAPDVLIEPNDLAFDPDANWQCTDAGAPLPCCSGAGTGTCTELYAVDAGGHQILVFRETAPSNWTLVRKWGEEGPENSQFQSPQAIAINATLDQVIVTDVDNFRVQVFYRNGVRRFQFGYRILYNTVSNNDCVAPDRPWDCCTGWRTGTCGTGAETAWFARSEGVAVDACSNIYISDALMGTVRAFDSDGDELDPAQQPVIGYGAGSETLRVPCDLMINAGKLYVADTNDGTIEVYDVSCTSAAAATAFGPPALDDAVGRTAKGQRGRVIDRSDGSVPVRAGVPQMPDNPAEIVAVMNAGEYREDLDMNRDRVIDVNDLEIAVARFGAGTVEDFLEDVPQIATPSHNALVPPHVLDIANRCGRCHSMDGAPGGMVSPAGQENLCQSCHSAGKIAGHDWIGPGGPGDPDMNHPWGVSAYDAEPGPVSNAGCTALETPWACCTGAGTGTCVKSEVALHLEAATDKVRCGTCHDPHESSQGECQVPSEIPGWEFPSHIGSCTGGSAMGHPCQSDAQCEMTFMRTQGNKVNLCGECHKEYGEWLHAGHSEEHADPWSHYDWNMGNNWLCTGPGTPYAYCTGEGVGAATSASAAVCTGPNTPLACCTGAGTGTCSLSAAACTGPGTPMTCCTGAGTGTCSSREACRQCHSGNGYIDFSNDFPDDVVNTSTHRGTFRVVDCLVCHTTHGKSHDEHLLRIYDDVRLPTGQWITGAGPGATCMACHNGRTGPPVQNSTTSLSTPHYLLGGVMLEGINGFAFDNTSLTNSAHTERVSCVDCHMAPSPAPGNPGAGKVGGHTFNMDVMDPDDPDYEFENVANACQGCHTGLTTLNRTARGDYDGDGVVEGVQDEVSGLLALVLAQLQAKGAFQLPGYPYWNLNAVPVADRILVKNAIWNWEYVDNSGDLGIKNTSYAVGLLQLTYEKLAGTVLANAYLRYVPTGQTASLQYTGTDACLTCHGAMAVTGTDYRSFLRTGHPYKLNEIKDGQMPSYPFSSIAGALEMVTDNDGAPGDPKPGTDNTLGTPASYDDVSYVIGGFGWKARWMDADGYVVTGSATQFNLETGGMAAYNDNQVDKKYDCGLCHTTGWKDYTSATGDTRNLNRQNNLPGMEGTFYAAGVQCEACHGAGSFHVAAPSADNITRVARARKTADLTAADMAYGKPIACSECHTRDGEKLYPTYVPAGNRIKASGGFIQHHEQYDEMVGINPDNVAAGAKGPHAPLLCVACHDAHTSTVYMGESGDPPGMKKHCSVCHNATGIGGKDYPPTNDMAGLVDCLDCHMPNMVKSAVSQAAVGTGPATGDIRTHIFKIDLSTTTQFTGTGAYSYPWITGAWACKTCHNNVDEFDLGFPSAISIHGGSPPGPNARRGGLLYDKWWVVNGAPAPTGNHPLYPPSGSQSGNVTYRCKECHGWEYLGKDGRYESGSHYTGIKGVLDAVTTMTETEIFDIVKNPNGDGTGGTTVNGHNFAAYGLSDGDINDLVAFIKNGGVIDPSPYINRAGSPGSYTYSFNGNAVAGAALYSGGVNPAVDCSMCHGPDGTAIAFGGVDFVGTLANDNPQETFHKIRFGHAGSRMTSYYQLGMTSAQSADVGAYGATLPQ